LVVGKIEPLFKKIFSQYPKRHRNEKHREIQNMADTVLSVP